MAEVGANIAILCRNVRKAEEAVETLLPFGGKYEIFACDVSDLKNVRKAVSEVYEAFGRIDILVNNAGLPRNVRFCDMEKSSGEWYRVLNTDLNGMVHMTL
jgi:NAD(P)-dependent dehydrogenase (short-subunit alcohol dehydrogenase family)